MTMMSDPISMQNLDLLTILDHQYNPCTSNQPLSSFIRQEKNGPFLRPLCSLWRQMGNPHLESLNSFNTTLKEYDHDEVTLATLSLQQEFTIASFIRHSYTTKEVFKTLQPFAMFASQLELFCKIKTDLVGLKDKIPDDQKDALYENIWQTTIQEFAQQKGLGCGDPNNRHEDCLGRLIWGKCIKIIYGITDTDFQPLGEAYDWSSSALYFSFIGYLEQLKKSKETEPNEIIYPVAPSSSSSVGMASISNPFTPATSLADSQGYPSPSNLDPSIQFSNINGLPASFVSKDHLSEPVTPSFIQSRRPTWTDFWDTNMIAHFLDSNSDLSLQQEQQQQLLDPNQHDVIEELSSPQSEMGESVFDIHANVFNHHQPQQQHQQNIIGSSILPIPLPQTDHLISPSPIRPKLNRSRSSSSSISKKQATSERSKRHYIKAKAERTVLSNICAKLNSLTYELQTSHQFHKNSITQAMVNARSGSNSIESIASLPKRADISENDVSMIALR